MTVTLEELKNMQAERSKLFGIGVKENYGFVEKPKIYESIADEDFADPVHYAYPVNDKPNTLASMRTFGNWDSKYTDIERQVVFAKLYAAIEKFKIDLSKMYFAEPEANTVESDNWIDVFKVGNHTDSSGKTQEWSEVDLQAIVDKYNNQDKENKHRAPAIVGEHQSDTSLVAYGWVKSLKFEDNHLFAQFEKLNKDFKEMVNEGSFNTISIGLYPDHLLQHIAFLGAKPPAIKGLEPPQFSEMTYTKTKQFASNQQNFNTNKEQSVDEFIKNVTAFLREKYGEDVSNDALAKMNELKGSVNLKPKDDKKDKPEFSESPEQIAQRKRLERVEKELQDEKDKTYFNEMAKKAIVLPRQQAAAKAILDTIRKSESTIQFSEDGPELSGETAFKEFLATFPPVVTFGEFAPMENFSSQDSAEERTKDLKEYLKERDKKRRR